MAYNPLIPLNSDSPSIFPAQSRENFTRLQKIVGADHQFNLSIAANDGYHNLIHMQIPNPEPSGIEASLGRLYAKTSALATPRVHAFYMDDQGTEYQVTPTMPIRAAVNFNGVAGAVIRGTAYNVSGVTQDSTGKYTITFDRPMPDNNYIVQVTGMRDNTNVGLTGCVAGNATYGTPVKTTSVQVQFFNNAGGSNDVFMGNVTVFSIS